MSGTEDNSLIDTLRSSVKEQVFIDKRSYWVLLCEYIVYYQCFHIHSRYCSVNVVIATIARVLLNILFLQIQPNT